MPTHLSGGGTVTPTSGMVFIASQAARLTLQIIKWTPPRIVQTAGVLGGRPRISGRRIAVQHIAVWHNQLDMNTKEIADAYDLELADVEAALTYYQTHRDEIDAAIQADAALATEMQQRYPSTLQAKLRTLSSD